MRTRSFAAMLVASLGVIGLAACIAVAIGTLLLASRLENASDRAFAAIGRAIAAVRDRTIEAETFVEESKLSTEELAENIRSRALEKTAGELASRLKIDDRSQQILLRLRQADSGLELAASSIEGLRPAAELAASLGAPIDGSLFAPTMDRIAALRTQLDDAAQTIARVNETAAEFASGDTPRERFEQVAQLAVRAALTLGELDNRLAVAADALAKTQTRVEAVQSAVRSRIVLAELLVLVLVAWMAAGQLCLLRAGWKDYRQQRAES